MKPLAGQTAIVTGAAAPNGIGRASAIRLSMDGASVVVTDVAGYLEVDERHVSRSELLADVVKVIDRGGGTAIAIEVDVTIGAEIERCVLKTQERFGRIDVLVNNAGTTRGTGPFLDATEDDWEASFRVNLLGPMRFCQAVIPCFRTVGGGAIVNVGSTGSLGADAGFGAYTAMKHGVVGLTKTIAAEFGNQGIRCNVICPGYVMTDMHAGVNARIAQERGISIEDVMLDRYTSVAMRRAATPGEVADAVAYFAGPSSSYVTGVALPIAGGLPVGL